ncbi:sodium-coupled monocarboxylate transporter 2 isoform X2 [Callorhinchus milii]|uniref:sodium-coupled monocarboxylate transporter 2 isoform X2 n=1 Tax=Callorhinchus milii TaxID=7868 RepID=UPI001C3FD7B9|nr:sodium-coupled monocarboxylate transporter 2 isoform X2 [Callorhinchus milii]
MPQFVNPGVGTFASWDYVVFAMLFIISSGVGIFFGIKERNKMSSRLFLMGDKQMVFGPMALSLTASFMSAVTVLGVPSDIYRFGASYILFCITFIIVVSITAEFFLPVFYRSGITSTYEYLELRFNKVILYTAIVVYAPSLALNQVTGFNLWGSITATGIVCTFYLTLGGFKAVVWTDAFQMLVMLLGFLTVLTQGTIKLGGSTNMWNIAKRANRLNAVDFSTDPLRRHSFWSIVVGGSFTWLGIYGVNQSIIQRCISCKSERHARIALYLNLVGLWVITICAVFSGLLMFVHYINCDPWTAGFISAPDQLMPYYVMDILGNQPGLPGLFVACAFGGTLSTVAASINSLATVTHQDLVKGLFPNSSEKLSFFISKGLCLLFGAICTAMAAAASLMGGIIQAALSIHGMCGGPMLGLFSLGILFPCSHWIGALGGFIIGILMSFWPAVNAFIYPALPRNTLPLFLNTSGCIPLNTSDSYSSVNPILIQRIYRPPLADSWYAISYLYYSALGFLGSLVGGLLISFISGSKYNKEVKPSLMRPVTGLFQFWSYNWCDRQHEESKPEDDNEKETVDNAQVMTGSESELQQMSDQASTRPLPVISQNSMIILESQKLIFLTSIGNFLKCEFIIDNLSL